MKFWRNKILNIIQLYENVSLNSPLNWLLNYRRRWIIKITAIKMRTTAGQLSPGHRKAEGQRPGSNYGWRELGEGGKQQRARSTGGGSKHAGASTPLSAAASFGASASCSLIFEDKPHLLFTPKTDSTNFVTHRNSSERE